MYYYIHSFRCPSQCTVAAIASPDRTPGSDGHEPNSDDEIAAERVFVVTVKYIRREIRSLTDFDREKFFNAVSVLQRVPSAVGQQVYGKKYYSKDYFNRLHLYYGTALKDKDKNKQTKQIRGVVRGFG